MTTALEGGEGSASLPGRSLPPGKDPVPIVQKAGWAPGPVLTRAENFAPPPGFDPRTVQHVSGRYTDYATRPVNPLNAELNPICHLLALLGAHPIFHVSRIRVKKGATGLI